MERSKVLLVDDHEVVRLGLKALINRQPALEVAGEAATAGEAIALAGALEPEVVLMDIRLGGTSGIEACQQIIAKRPGTRVVMLTSYAEDEMLFAAMRAGAVGYVLKQAGGQAVIRAIQSALAGKSMLDPASSENAFYTVRQAAHAQAEGAFGSLNAQEQRVLARITTGDSNREIAQQLHLGEGTVRNYVSNILEKLQVANRAEAAAYATRHQLSQLLARE